MCICNFPRRCGRVDTLGQADERDTERLEILEQRNQVLEVAPEAIEPPAYKHVEASALSGEKGRIDRRWLRARLHGPALMCLGRGRAWRDGLRADRRGDKHQA